MREPVGCGMQERRQQSPGQRHTPLQPHLPSALALGENILADSVRLRNETPLPMWLCTRRGAGTAKGRQLTCSMASAPSQVMKISPRWLHARPTCRLILGWCAPKGFMSISSTNGS